MDTHANRSTYPATQYINTIYIETDRNNLVYLSDGTNWIYIGGKAGMATGGHLLGVPPFFSSPHHR